MKVLEIQISEILLNQVEGYNRRFIDEGIKEWDKLVGKSLCFPEFMRCYVNDRWIETVAKN